MTANGALKVLLEMRPALDGHAGIPQETRLLFRGLGRLPDIEPIGLIQHHARVLGRGLPLDVRKRAKLPVHKQVDRLSRVSSLSSSGAAIRTCQCPDGAEALFGASGAPHSSIHPLS